MSLFFFSNNFYKNKETDTGSLWNSFGVNDSRINNDLLYVFSHQYYVLSMHRAAVWQDSNNSDNKIVHSSIEHFLCNLSDSFSDDVLSCLWIVFTNSVFQIPPQKIVRQVEILGIGWPGVISLT